jgi:hypothetical protein
VGETPQLGLEESTYSDAETLGGARPESDEARSATILDGFKTMSFEFYDGTDSLDCPGNWCSSWNPMEAETIPAAVRIKVEGLFGFDEDVWGQEIPLMAVAATYAEASGELGDLSELQDCEAFETTSGGGTGTGTGTDKSGGKEKDEDADDDDEGDE